MLHAKPGLFVAVLGAGVLALSLAGPAFAARTHQTSAPFVGHTSRGTYIAHLVGEPDAAHLRQDLKAGKTLLQIAQTYHKFDSADALATAVLAPLKARMDRAAQQNPSLAATERTRYNTFHARVVKLVQTQHPMVHGGHAGASRHAGGRGLIHTLATACGAQDASLLAALKAGGKSPLAICRATAPTMSQGQLVSALMSALKTRLDSIAAVNPALKQHEGQILARIQARMNTWVVRTMPARAYLP